MYHCLDCGHDFDIPDIIYETHGLSSPPYEKYSVCPNCKGKSFNKKSSSHCRCCGAKLKEADSDYCSEQCRIRGRKLWEKQYKLRKVRQSSPISVIITEMTAYNREHKTNLSYGQYVALIRGKKNVGRKKEIS